MNFILSFLSYAVLGGIAAFFLPWWIIVPIGLILGFFFKGKPGFAFLIGLGSQLLIWGIAASWISIQNDGILIEKMGNLLGGLSPTLLLLIIALIGGLTGGLSTWCGNLFRKSPSVENTL